MIAPGDFITSQFFQSLASQSSHTRNFDPKVVQPNDVVYTRHGARFLTVYHAAIEAPYVLLSNYHDRQIDTVPEVIEDPKLVAWYGVNMSVSHPKMIPIPLALDSKRLPTAQKILDKSDFDRSVQVYMNFTVNNPERRAVWDRLAAVDGVLARAYDKHGLKIYYEDLTRAQFVLSPKGNGQDCYRTWEALLMGATPIVQTSFLDHMLRDYPVKIVDSWQDLNVATLQWSEQPKCPKLTKAYWVEHLQQMLGVSKLNAGTGRKTKDLL